MLKSIERDDHDRHNIGRLDNLVRPEELRLPIVGMSIVMAFVLAIMGYFGYQIWHLLRYMAPGWPW